MRIIVLAAIICAIGAAPDGKGGFVWKPQGDHFPKNAVVVLPKKYAGSASHVVLFHGDRFLYKCPLKSGGICQRGQHECLGRPTFLCPHSGGKLLKLFGDITVRADIRNKQCETFAIADPSKRVD